MSILILRTFLLYCGFETDERNSEISKKLYTNMPSNYEAQDLECISKTRENEKNVFNKYGDDWIPSSTKMVPIEQKELLVHL